MISRSLLSALVGLFGMSATSVLALDLNPLTAIKSVVEAAVEDRSSGDIAKDLAIKGKLTAQLIDKMGSGVLSINADVYEQIVMMSGSVKTEDQKSIAGKLAAAAQDVKKVYNEILVIKPIDKEKGIVENFVDDTVIESKINALLLDASGVNVTNFRYRSVGGMVFLFGRALSRAELQKAISVIKSIENVSSVKDRVMVRPRG